MSQVQAEGKTIEVCSYKWTSPDGKVELCHHVSGCPICHQCSRLVGDHESGHCTGHNGLMYGIKVPGQDGVRVRAEVAARRPNKPQGNRKQRRQGKKA